jgi:hypothetical protein
MAIDTRSRNTFAVLATACVWAASGCAVAVAYRSDPDLPGSLAAKIAFVPATSGPQGVAKLLFVDIYGYDQGCPDVDGRSASRGYLGSLGTAAGGFSPIAVPGDEPFVFRSRWDIGGRTCDAVTVFRPQTRANYSFGLGPALAHGTTCEVAITRSLVDPDGSMRTEPAYPVAAVAIQVRGYDLQADPFLCELAAIKRDRSGTADPMSAAAAAAAGAAASAAAAKASDARTPGAPVGQPSAAATAGAERQQSPAATPPERPLARRAGTAPKLSDHETPSTPAATPSLSTPGTGIFVRIGFSLGGETLFRTDRGGGSLDAGKGAILTLGAMATPLWASDTAGFGVAGEVGWMGGGLSASNGSASFDRFPVVGTVHVLLRPARRWGILLGGGVRKDFGASLTGTGAGNLGRLEPSGGLGGLGQVGLYHSFAPNVAFDGMFRVTALQYDIEGVTVDATNFGLSMGLHFDL